MSDNTLPMMTGFGQFGPIEMGGMFTVVKIREGLGRDDYSDPGAYQHPPGALAYEVKETGGEPSRRSDKAPPEGAATVKAVKPKPTSPQQH